MNLPDIPEISPSTLAAIADASAMAQQMIDELSPGILADVADAAAMAQRAVELRSTTEFWASLPEISPSAHLVSSRNEAHEIHGRLNDLEFEIRSVRAENRMLRQAIALWMLRQDSQSSSEDDEDLRPTP